jgi:hypothetical protein
MPDTSERVRAQWGLGFVRRAERGSIDAEGCRGEMALRCSQFSGATACCREALRSLGVRKRDLDGGLRDIDDEVRQAVADVVAEGP